MVYVYYNKETFDVIGWYIDKMDQLNQPFVELEDDHHIKLIEKLNSNSNLKAIVVNNTVVLVKTEPKITWDDIRAQRNFLLKETDYTQLPDYPAEKGKKYKKYRQTLRDITTLFKSPKDVKWPEIE